MSTHPNQKINVNLKKAMISKQEVQTKEEKTILRKHKQTQANKNRSSKNKRIWNYVKAIQANYYPNKSLKEIRSFLKKHRKGLETDISDVAWRNPSP